ncbi:small integral membrane protein 24 [Scyliorhinus canicula]|uniref:small integral membrane protein 24 n=1 Tax=Scyliorhinus canicula TaxID=7830 RepID=UPI0018F6B26D|nr:small integral membrane protein 24 [Scyliorhinus canicula]
MAFPCRVLAALLLISAVSAQSAKANKSTAWQPWLTGLTAVTVFLFVVFALLIINRVFCARNKESDQPNIFLNTVDTSAASNQYTNTVMIEDDKRTSL